MDGQDKTKQISDWKISQSGESLWLTCSFPSGKEFKLPLSKCKIAPTEEMHNKLLTRKDSYRVEQVDHAVVYGNKYVVLQYSGKSKRYLMKYDDVHLVEQSDASESDVFQYFKAVSRERVAKSNGGLNSGIADNVLRQLEDLPLSTETALYGYCKGHSQPIQSHQNLIFPFGLNDSQLKALASVFSSQVSIIEGPPGTGKTQTILNILANILLQGKTVAILSNNNAAVENIYEKLAKNGLDFLVAKLGSVDKRSDFFSDIPELPTFEQCDDLELSLVEEKVEELTQLLYAQNEAAGLKSQIDELRIEYKYLLKCNSEYQSDSTKPFSSLLKKYRLSKLKTLDLISYLTFIKDSPITLRNRFELLLNFRIFRTGPFSSVDNLNAMTSALQLKFYSDELKEKEEELAACEKILIKGNFESLLHDVTTSSMSYFKQQISQRKWSKETFSSDNYRFKIDDFLRRYPIIGSGTHSIVNSIKAGTVLDYAIIDEASQQDIIPGILALGCAKNLVVVGDRKQLPPIFTETEIPAPDERYDCGKYSLLDSCLRVFGDTAPVTLLKEHYRCHPKIIQFCNQQFYNNQLIPMTQDNGEVALQLVVTSKGNHTRGYKNLRELDSLLEIQKKGESSHWDETSNIGFIAPYNAQVDLSQLHLPANFIKDTTHRFQGRECEKIIFSTVLDEKPSNVRSLSFVDNSNLINVAVSRAKHQFTLVTGERVFSALNGPIAALIRYIEYYDNGTSNIYRSPVISAFDLLYREYDISLDKLRSRLRPNDSEFLSEQIVAELLRKILSSASYDGVMFHMEVELHKLVARNYEGLTEYERRFMIKSRCDFVIYHKVGKKPFAVIEVDGGSHDTPEQQRRDALKNSILQKVELTLFRLKTDESRIEEKIEQFISSALGLTQSKEPDFYKLSNESVIQ